MTILYTVPRTTVRRRSARLIQRWRRRCLQSLIFDVDAVAATGARGEALRRDRRRRKLGKGRESSTRGRATRPPQGEGETECAATPILKEDRGKEREREKRAKRRGAVRTFNRTARGQRTRVRHTPMQQLRSPYTLSLH